MAEYDWSNEERVLLEATQRRGTELLNSTDRWAIEDMSSLFLSGLVWLPDRDAFEMPISFLKVLAFDSRTEDGIALMLQQAVADAETENQLYLPSNFYERYGNNSN